jgi:hypothetical protein
LHRNLVVGRRFIALRSVLLNKLMGGSRSSLRMIRLLGGTGGSRVRGDGASIAVPFAVCAVALAVAVWAAKVVLASGDALGSRLAAASALAAAAVGFVVAALAVRRGLRRRQPPPAWLVVDALGVHRVERGKTTALASFGSPIGITVFSSADRSKLLVALTSPQAVRTVAVRVRDTHDAAAAHTLIARATTAADGDLLVADDWSLSAADAERLVLEVARRSPGALDRLLLTDSTGDAVVLDRGELRVGAHRFDLSKPLEWNASLFQELGAYAVSVFQATWLRQADHEVVFVSPVPPEGSEVRSASAAVQAAGEAIVVQAAFALDVRLMQASPGEPPPREARRAIDRVFMLPLRRALDRAPRIARPPVPPPRSVADVRRSERDRRERHR